MSKALETSMRMNVPFTTQLHHQLKAIARGREFCDRTSTTRDKGREINGWEVEKKVSLLNEIRNVLEIPSFIYSDCGPLHHTPLNNNGVLFMESYFNKTLCLEMGQHTLLDVWEYIMDMCAYVPIRNHCRSLYLHVAVCICRRIEFINGFRIGNDRVTVDDKVNERYYELFGRCITLCIIQLEHSHILTEEYALFTAHIVAMIHFRCPSESLRLMHAVEECARVLRKDSKKWARRRSRSLPVMPYPPPSVASPTHPQHQWHLVLENHLTSEAHLKRMLSEFSTYKKSGFLINQYTTSTSNPRRTVESTLRKALEADMIPGQAITLEESTFIANLPIFFSFYQVETTKSFQVKVSEAVSIFSRVLQTPERDQLFIVPYIGAYLNDITYWCHAVDSNQRILWHCIPGYIPFIYTYMAIMERMCQRRPRKIDENVDPWSSYWTTFQVTGVLDTLNEVLQNTHLVNPLIHIILQSTNLFDPINVNYSFSVLQRVVTIAATCTRFQGLSPDFDVDYFVMAMNRAFQSAHVQILLKALTCLYSCIDFLPPSGRRLILSQLVLRENFSRLFLHWNEEICKIYSYILVFKLFVSTRLDLPCATDRILLAQSPFFRNQSTKELTSPPPSPFRYWSHLSDFAHTILPRTSIQTRQEQRKRAMTLGLQHLVQWDSIQVVDERFTQRNSIFRASLEDEDKSVDLLVASKLDSMLKMLADHMGKRVKESNTNAIMIEQQAYAARAMTLYVGILWDYYVAAFETPGVRPTAPKLEFTITTHGMGE